MLHRGLLHRGRNLFFAADIGLDEKGVASDITSDFGAVGASQVEESHAGSLSGQSSGGGFTESGSASRDYGGDGVDLHG